MGEVYRGRDAALGRDVALKVLPASFAQDADRLARFAREAQALAALNHPNIAQIYGIESAGGSPALVMEFVDGPTLADLVRQQALGDDTPARVPIEDVVALARQIASGLEAAHEKGIVHRDLKPANVKITADGQVKILDFGLAKALSPDPASTDAMNSPTLTGRSTEAGLILGTAAYMSPEQARGRPVDKRADIWSFGVLVYELLTGVRAFDGETVSDMLAAVLKTDPDWSRLPDDTPASLRRLLIRCLERDPTRRLRDIGEARVALDSRDDSGVAMPPTASAAAALAPVPLVRRPLPWMVAAAVCAVAAAVLWSTRPAVMPSGFELSIAPPDGAEYQIGSNLGGVVVSPNGTMVAFIAATADAGQSLWVRSLVRNDARALPQTLGASNPFWSPDGSRLGFFAGGKLRVIDISSGLPEVIADAAAGRGGTWSEDGTIVFSPVGGGAMFRVASTGGQVDPISQLDAARGENAHYWPVFLPDNKTVLYFVRSTIPENNGIYLTHADGAGTPTRLLSALSSAAYASSARGGLGYMLWVRDADLLAQHLDIEARALVGPVSTVASNVRVEESQRGLLASVSRTGVLAWADARAANAEFVIVNRDGRQLDRLAVDAGQVFQPQWSPDGTNVLFMRASNGTADVWLHDLSTHVTRQVTSDPDYDENAVWSPDGTRMTHLGTIDGKRTLILTALDGAAPPRALYRGGAYSGGAWTPDGRHLLFAVLGAQTGVDIWGLPLANPDAALALNTDLSDDFPLGVSPDGQWVAIASSKGGTPEAFLTRLIRDGDTLRLGSQRIVIGKGTSSLYWRKDGREMLTASLDGHVIATPISVVGEALSTGQPVPLFKLPTAATNDTWTPNADATQFIVSDAPRAGRQSLHILTNWETRLRK
jgi:Tol biopolymer transport system component